MADTEIAPDVIETAARALADWLNLDFDRIGDGQKTLRRQAEAVLNAAAPHLDLVATVKPDEVDDERVAYWGSPSGLHASFVSSGPDGDVDMSYAPFSRRVDPAGARAMAAQLLAAAKYAESFCGGCEKTPCACEPDQGGEYPCTNCGTTGWDCLTQMNSTPAERRCCHRCPYIDGHKRPELRAQS